MNDAQPAPTGQASALEMKEVRKSFGPTEIIRGLNLEVHEGERHAVIGPNGAGKSTLFNLISGLYEVSSGTIALRGREITNLTPHVINRMGLARSFQVVNLFPMMTVFENVRCGLLWSAGEKYSFWRAINNLQATTEKVEDLLERTGLLLKRDFPAAMLPYADQRALELSVTLACGADVLLLDEPTCCCSTSRPPG